MHRFTALTVTLLLMTASMLGQGDLNPTNTYPPVNKNETVSFVTPGERVLLEYREFDRRVNHFSQSWEKWTASYSAVDSTAPEKRSVRHEEKLWRNLTKRIEQIRSLRLSKSYLLTDDELDRENSLRQKHFKPLPGTASPSPDLAVPFDQSATTSPDALSPFQVSLLALTESWWKWNRVHERLTHSGVYGDKWFRLESELWEQVSERMEAMQTARGDR